MKNTKEEFFFKEACSVPVPVPYNTETTITGVGESVHIFKFVLYGTYYLPGGVSFLAHAW